MHADNQRSSEARDSGTERKNYDDNLLNSITSGQRCYTPISGVESKSRGNRDIPVCVWPPD